MKDRVTVLDQLELEGGGQRVIAGPVPDRIVQVEGFFSAESGLSPELLGRMVDYLKKG